MNRARELDAALQVLARFYPDETSRARRALDVLLEGIRRSHWPEVAWEFSRLTGDRFPVELSFSSSSAEVRYTSEVDGPERPPAERLDRAIEHLERLGSPLLEAPILELLRTTQAAGTLHTGAWIAGRHSAHSDRFKVYAEIPPEADARSLLPALLPRRLAELAGTLGRVRMVGHEPSTGTTEIYFRSRGLETWQLGRLLVAVRLADHQEALIRRLEALAGRRMGDRLPGSAQGFSLVRSPGGDAVTYLSFARTLAGGDGRIRRRTLALAADQRWDMEAYAELSRSLSERNDWRTVHGMVAFPVQAQGVGLQIGLRPPRVAA